MIGVNGAENNETPSEDQLIKSRDKDKTKDDAGREEESPKSANRPPVNSNAEKDEGTAEHPESNDNQKNNSLTREHHHEMHQLHQEVHEDNQKVLRSPPTDQDNHQVLQDHQDVLLNHPTAQENHQVLQDHQEVLQNHSTTQDNHQILQDHQEVLVNHPTVQDNYHQVVQDLQEMFQNHSTAQGNRQVLQDHQEVRSHHQEYDENTSVEQNSLDKDATPQTESNQIGVHGTDNNKTPSEEQLIKSRDQNKTKDDASREEKSPKSANRPPVNGNAEKDEGTAEHPESKDNQKQSEEEKMLQMLRNNPDLLKQMMNTIQMQHQLQPPNNGQEGQPINVDNSSTKKRTVTKETPKRVSIRGAVRLPKERSSEESTFITKSPSNASRKKGRDVRSKTLSPWFMKQVKNLGLDQFYPGKLKQKHLIKIFPSDINENEHCPKGLLFLQNLLHVNTQSRRIFESEDNDIEESDSDSDECCSYATAILIIFLCADPFLRRYLVEKMQMCQFAIPFILPITNEVLLWPLRIVRNWKTKCRAINESCIACEAMPMLSLMQIGDFDTCVSAEFLNLTFSEPGYEGFSNVVNEDQNKVSDGLVEVAWFLPRGRPNDAFSDALIAASLRGNANEHCANAQYLLEVSDVVVLITDSLEEVDETFTENKNAGKLIIALKSAKSKKLRPFKHGSIQVMPFIHIEGCIRSLRGKLNELFCNITNSLEDRVKLAEAHGFIVDETENACFKGKEKAMEVKSYIDNENVFLARKKFFPFQEEWKEWTRLDKEQTRRKNFSTIFLAKSHIEECELKKQKIEKRLTWSCLSNCFKKFLSHLKEGDEREKMFFIEWLRFFLNERSRFVAHALQSEVEDHFQDPKELSKIGERLANSSLGIEHFFREAGMVWTILSKKVNKGLEHLRWLPWSVASLLLEGYPLEVLNGDASYVAFDWIKEVFQFINELVGPNLQVFVTSILGVQSSGKSTFLNTMFGINFAVSSGRCTKGAFMQLVEVDSKIQEELGCNYLVVIDTEGLKSAEHISYDSKHDNELGTLAVGVADLSVMNIGGENDDSMKDVLQIICFALLRMTIVWEDRPKCMMVHQNVADLAAAHNTTAGKLRFFQTLDEMTKLAAELENCSQKYQRFKDVIDYDAKKMDIYIPGLWQGSPPMASVNIDYSDASQKTKRLLINEITKTSSLDAFITRIRDVFKAVKQENFIFSFQNTVAAKAHQSLAQIYNREKWNCKTEILNWFTNLEVNLRETGNYSEREKKKAIVEVENIVKEYVLKLENVVTKYFEEHQEVAGMIERSRSIFEEDIRSTKRMATQESVRKIEELFLNFRNEEKVLKVTISGEQHFKPRLLELKKKYGEAKCKLTEEQKERLETDFEDEWTTFLNGIECSQLNDDQDIESVMMANLLDKLQGQEQHLTGNPPRELRYLVTAIDIDLNRGPKIAKTIDVLKIGKDYEKEAIDTVQKLANEVLRSCKNFIAHQTKDVKMFREDICYKLISYADELLSKIKGDTFSCRNYFKVRMLEIICYYAIDKFVEMRERYKEAHDPRRKLELSKGKYLNLLLSLVEAENLVKVFSSEIEYGIMSGLQNHFQVALRNHIGDEKLELCNRKQVQLAILVQLNEEASFEKYKEYLKDFKGFCLSWLRKEVETYLGENMERGCTRFVEIMLKRSEFILKNFLEALDESGQENEYHDFLEALRNTTRANNIHVGFDEGCMERLTTLPVNDVPKFIEDVKQHIEDETKNIVREKVEELDVKEELDKIDPPIEDQLYEALMCKDGEQCPFCKAPCDVIGVHEEHKTDIHQPQGFAGCVVRETTTLDTEECPVSIALDNVFSDSMTHHRPVSYMKYKNYYPNWLIPADAHPATSKYWKMVLMNFNKEFAEEFGTNQVVIPESWRGYQWPVVRKELEELYEQTIPE